MYLVNVICFTSSNRIVVGVIITDIFRLFGVQVERFVFSGSLRWFCTFTWTESSEIRRGFFLWSWSYRKRFWCLVCHFLCWWSLPLRRWCLSLCGWGLSLGGRSLPLGRLCNLGLFLCRLCELSYLRLCWLLLCRFSEFISACSDILTVCCFQEFVVFLVTIVVVFGAVRAIVVLGFIETVWSIKKIYN